MKKKTDSKSKINGLFEEPKIEEGKDLSDMEYKWKKATREILDRVGISSPYINSMDTYDNLIRAHKKIFGEKHDSYWVGFGMGVSRSQLDTYLLIKIHGMLKCVVEKGIELKDNLSQNEDENIHEEQQEWIAKEDFEEIDLPQLPDEFRKQLDDKYAKKGFINSEGIYRVKIQNRPINPSGYEGTMDCLMDYNPKADNKFRMHGIKIKTSIQ